MTWTDPPSITKGWEKSHVQACLIAGNGVLSDGGNDTEALKACIAASGRSRQIKWVEMMREIEEHQEGFGLVKITAKDIRDAEANFRKSKNGFIPIEMGAHNSPEIGGRVIDVQVRPGYGGVLSLWGLAYFNDMAASEIDSGNLESLSIEGADWTDRETGDRQGFTLFAVALLPPGREFIEGMQPVMLSRDGGNVKFAVGSRLTLAVDGNHNKDNAPAKPTSIIKSARGKKMKFSEAIEMLKSDELTAEQRDQAIVALEAYHNEADGKITQLSALDSEKAQLEAELAEAREKIEELSKGESDATVQLAKTNDKVKQLSAQIDKLEGAAAEREADLFLKENEDRIYPSEVETLKTLMLGKEGAAVRKMIADRPKLKLGNTGGDIDDEPGDKEQAIIRLANEYKEKGVEHTEAFKRAAAEVGKGN